MQHWKLLEVWQCDGQTMQKYSHTHKNGMKSSFDVHSSGIKQTNVSQWNSFETIPVPVIHYRWYIFLDRNDVQRIFVWIVSSDAMFSIHIRQRKKKRICFPMNFIFWHCIPDRFHSYALTFRTIWIQFNGIRDKWSQTLLITFWDCVFHIFVRHLVIFTAYGMALDRILAFKFTQQMR